MALGHIFNLSLESVSWPSHRPLWIQWLLWARLGNEVWMYQPEVWKTSKLTFIPKPEGRSYHHYSHRPYSQSWFKAIWDIDTMIWKRGWHTLVGTSGCVFYICCLLDPHLLITCKVLSESVRIYLAQVLSSWSTGGVLAPADHFIICNLLHCSFVCLVISRQDFSV